MKLNKIISLTVLLFGVIVLVSSCKSKEQRLIDQIKELTQRMEEDGDDFTIDDWNAIIAEHAEIASEINECDFDFDERRELSKAEREFQTTLIKKGAKSIMGEYLNLGSQFVNGLMEGLEDFQDNWDKKEKH